MIFFIRNAQMEDSESITELSNQLGYKSENLVVQKRLQDILSHRDNCVFVALEGERIIGWVHGYYARRVESEPFVEIGGLVVDTDYRKKGIGKLLIAEITKWSVIMECPKVRVRCNSIRKEANLFYQSLGFDVNKVQNVYEWKQK